MISILYSPAFLVTIYSISEFFVIRLNHSSGHAVDRDRGSLTVLIRVVFLSIALASLTKLIFPQMEFEILRQFAWPGVALFFAGISLRWLAIAYLGRFFTVEVAIESGHQIVDHGPYRYLRHPSYTGLLLMFLGMGICSANALSLLLVLLPVFLALRYRIRIEETVLQDAFGKAYADYAQKTWRMIPFIY